MAAVAEAPTIQLELASRPESVAVVRAMLAGAAKQLEFGPELLADLKTAVSEACNNVVMHAYPGETGPLIVNLVAGTEILLVTVRDCGRGMDAAGQPDDHAGVGVAVMTALAVRAEFESSRGRGTEVRMLFAYRRDDVPVLRSAPTPDATINVAMHLQGEVVLSVSPVSLLGSILGRVTGAVAAQAYFPIDHYSDLYLITDEIAAHAGSFARDSAVSVALAVHLHRLDLRAGPFLSGSTPRLQFDESGGRPFLIDVLVDDVQVETPDGSEALHLLLIEPRAKENG